VRTDKAKNDFEGVIYAMREWVNEDTNIPYVGVEKQEEILKNLTDNEDWLLEGEGEHATYIEYNQKYYELNSVFQAMKQRKEEHEVRDEKVSDALSKIESYKDKIE